MKMISKDTFLRARDCAYGAWHLHREAGEPPVTPGNSLRMWEGQEIHRRARRLYPDGVLVAESGKSAGAKTPALLDVDGPPVVFEALIEAPPLVARPDILIRDGRGWRLVEVKSSVNMRPDLIDDLAYTRMTLNRARLEVTSCELLLLSREYRKHDPDDRLFAFGQPAAKLDRAQATLEAEAESICATLLATNEPPAVPCGACRQCGLQLADCPVRHLRHPVYELPRLTGAKIDQLVAAGVREISEVPPTFRLTPDQELVRRTIVDGVPWISPRLRNLLERVRWPAYYLDFETVNTALPLYEGVGPWTQVPTQFSVHVCDRPGNVVDHREFLARPDEDPRKDLCVALLDALGTEGSIIVYSGFESRVLQDLQGWVSDLVPALAGVQERLVDLCAILKDGYRHPEFDGSLSIKKTLPATVPAMSYDNLNIAEGDTASAVYALMALGQIPAEEWAERRADLLEYCKHDTLAMVRVHEALSVVA